MRVFHLSILIAALAVAIPAFAQPTTLPPEVVFAQPTAVPAALPPVVAAPAVTQNTIATTGNVASTTTISVGTLAGQILNWIMVAFGPVIGSIVVWILVRVLQKLGIDATDALRERLQAIVVNGLNAGAKSATEQLQGKGQIEIKNAVVASAVAYTQEHGAETIKALGLDPQSGPAVAAIKARIETAINDPTAPTPAVLNPVPNPTILQAPNPLTA